MKIIEAQRLYQAQQVSLREQKKKLLQQKEDLQQKISATNNGKEIYANEAATLELSIGAITQKTEENNEVLNTLAEQYAAVWNTEVAKQQGEAMKEYGEDMAKILEVARRIAKGAKVPATDEKKLMEYSMEMYMSAKNMAMMKRQRKKKNMIPCGMMKRKRQNTIHRERQIMRKLISVHRRHWTWVQKVMKCL